jgi:tetratricopeptide (TPR) repeat protein
VAEAPITRTCSKFALTAALAAVLAAPGGAARIPSPSDGGRTYVAARAAEFSGDHGRSAMLLAQLAETDTGNKSLGRRAASQAISAGAMSLALKLGRSMPQDSLTTDVRLLLAADELLRGRAERAQAYLSGGGEDGDLSFIAPYVSAWTAVDRRNVAAALTILEQIAPSSLLGSYVNEQRAYILIKARMTQDAEPYARRAIAQGAQRETQMRLAMADSFLAAGDKARALAMLDAASSEVVAARARIAAGRSLGTAVDTPAKAFADMLVGLSLDLNRVNATSFPIRLVQVARYAWPESGAASIVLGALLQTHGRTPEALAAFNSVRSDSLLATQARDAQARALTDGKRFGEALALAQSAAAQPTATSLDYSRLGDVLVAMKRYRESADAYQKAIDRLEPEAKDDLWTLLLL